MPERQRFFDYDYISNLPDFNEELCPRLKTYQIQILLSLVHLVGQYWQWSGAADIDTIDAWMSDITLQLETAEVCTLISDVRLNGCHLEALYIGDEEWTDKGDINACVVDATAIRADPTGCGNLEMSDDGGSTYFDIANTDYIRRDGFCTLDGEYRLQNVSNNNLFIYSSAGSLRGKIGTRLGYFWLGPEGVIPLNIGNASFPNYNINYFPETGSLVTGVIPAGTALPNSPKFGVKANSGVLLYLDQLHASDHTMQWRKSGVLRGWIEATGRLVASEQLALQIAASDSNFYKAADLDIAFSPTTVGSRRGRVDVRVYNVATPSIGQRWDFDSNGQIATAVLGKTPTLPVQSVAGNVQGNTALRSFLAAMEGFGWIVDNAFWDEYCAFYDFAIDDYSENWTLNTGDYVGSAYYKNATGEGVIRLDWTPIEDSDSTVQEVTVNLNFVGDNGAVLSIKDTLGFTFASHTFPDTIDTTYTFLLLGISEMTTPLRVELAADVDSVIQISEITVKGDYQEGVWIASVTGVFC